MNFTLEIKNTKSISEIAGYWSDEDYINLLDEFNLADAKNSKSSELRELLEMAISDFEPHESAEILLKYKLQDKLSSSQIRNLSHELAEDNESEDNSNITLHYPLFSINQLLNRSYNGIFPKPKATQIDLKLSFKREAEIIVTKEIVLKAISYCLSNKNPLKRLFENQLNGKEPFGDAEDVIWELHKSGPTEYTIITSDYWISEEDITENEITGLIKLFEEKE